MTPHFYGVLLFYNLIMPLAFLVAIPGYLVKMFRRGNYGQDFCQRFGLYSARARRQLQDAGNPIWIHAVSVGEVLIAHKLIRKFQQIAPEIPIVLSCTTSTGYALAQERQDIGYLPIYNPLDMPLFVWSAFRTIRPRQIVLVESEIWPNLLWQAKQRRVPLSLVNARLSPRSERRFAKFGLLTRPLFQQMDQVLVQEPQDIDRWARLGVPREKLNCTGSIKFDQEGQPKPAEQIEQFRQLLGQLRAPGTENAPVILIGSSFAGEEKLIGQAYRILRETFPGAFYIAVPRHWERGGAVKKDLESIGLAPVLKTELDTGTAPATPDPERCLIVNTTGELYAWYHFADLVLIGKSFLAEGGQNPIEPLGVGKPIIMGAHMQNFEPLVSTLVKEQGGRQLPETDATSAPVIATAMTELLQAPDTSLALVSNGQRILATHQGAAQRSCTALIGLRGEK